MLHDSRPSRQVRFGLGCESPLRTAGASQRIVALGRPDEASHPREPQTRFCRRFDQGHSRPQRRRRDPGPLTLTSARGLPSNHPARPANGAARPWPGLSPSRPRSARRPRPRRQGCVPRPNGPQRQTAHQRARLPKPALPPPCRSKQAADRGTACRRPSPNRPAEKRICRPGIFASVRPLRPGSVSVARWLASWRDCRRTCTGPRP